MKRAGKYPHECAENVELPEAVRFVHQLTDHVVVEVQLVDLVGEQG